MNDTGAHPDYLPTGFSKKEKDVLVENGLLDAYISKVPDYSPTDLTTDSFKLYTKSYAPWTCSSLYPTTDVTTQAQKIDHISQDSASTFIITIVQMIQFIIMFFVLQSLKQKGNTSGLKKASFASIFISCALYVMITYYFFSIFSQIVKINKSQIQYYIDNGCSSTIVLYSFQHILNNITSMSVYSLLGGLLTSILLIVDIVASLDSFGVLKKFRKGHNEDFEQNSHAPLIHDDHHGERIN